jgi:hypothetical protein
MNEINNFILYENYGLNEKGGSIDIINDFFLYIKKNQLVEYTNYKFNVFNYFNKLNLNELKIKTQEILNEKYYYIPLILPKHLVGIFVYKHENSNNYDLSIINTGSGIEYQKIFNKNILEKKINFTNGIIIFRNISINNITDTIEYILFLNTISDNYSIETIFEFLYTCIYDKILNYSDIDFTKSITEKTILFELPSQIIGDCSLKSFIYSFVLMKFYNLAKFNLSESEQYIYTNKNIYTDENLLLSLKNYWSFYFEIFNKLTDDHIIFLKKKNYDEDLNKDLNKDLNEDYEFSSQNTSFQTRNSYMSSLYIIKEKNYQNNLLFKFYNKIDNINYSLNDQKISETIIFLNNDILKKYNDDILNQIDNFNYWIELPNISYDINKYTNEKSNTEHNIFKLYEEIQKLNNIKINTTNESLNILIKEIIISINNYNNNLFNDNKRINNKIYEFKIYGIYKNLLEFLFKTRNIEYSYENFKNLLDFFIKFKSNNNINYDINYDNDNDNYDNDNYNNNDLQYVSYYNSYFNQIIELIYGFIFIKIYLYIKNIYEENKDNCEIFKILINYEFNNNNEIIKLNKQIFKKFISKKFIDYEIFDSKINEYIIEIQNSIYLDKINYNIILFTQKSEIILTINFIEKYLLPDDKIDEYKDLYDFTLKTKKVIDDSNYNIDNILEQFKQYTSKIKKLTKNIEKNRLYEYDFKDIDKLNLFNVKDIYNLINNIIFEYTKLIKLKIISLLNKNKNNNIIKIILNFLNIDNGLYIKYKQIGGYGGADFRFFNSDSDFINTFDIDKNHNDINYLLNDNILYRFNSLDFINPFEKDNMEKENENIKVLKYTYDDGEKYLDYKIIGERICNYKKINHTNIDIHYLVECVNNNIFPEIFLEDYILITHNYYVYSKINSKNKIYEHNNSSYNLFSEHIKVIFENNIDNYLEKIINIIPISINCINYLMIIQILLLFCHSIDIKIKNLYKIINLINEYSKIYLFNDTNNNILIFNIKITLLLVCNNIQNENITIFKKDLLNSILLFSNKFKEKYYWYLLSISDLFELIINDNKYKQLNDNIDIYKRHFKNIEFFSIKYDSDIYIKPLINKQIYNYSKINSLELLINKDNYKLYNYISYYCYLLINFFKWNRINDNYIFGKYLSEQTNFNYSILYDHKENKYYKIIDNNITEENINIEYLNSCDLLLNKEEIIIYLKENILFRKFINKIKNFLSLEQIIFWKIKDSNVKYNIIIEIPEYNLSFNLINIDTENSKLKFKNYDLEFDYETINTILIFNLVSNSSNIFLMKNTQDNEYYLLNFGIFNDKTIKYYDILKIHYSNMFIIFDNDTTLLNYINSLKYNCDNYIIIKNIKNNILFQKIFNKNSNNNIINNLKKQILSNNKILYNNQIIEYTKSNYNEIYYKNYIKNINELIIKYISNINNNWNEYNFPFIMQINNNYIILKFIFDNYYIKNYFNSEFINIVKNIYDLQKIFIYNQNEFNEIVINRNKKSNYRYDYDSDYDYDFNSDSKNNNLSEITNIEYTDNEIKNIKTKYLLFVYPDYKYDINFINKIIISFNKKDIEFFYQKFFTEYFDNYKNNINELNNFINKIKCSFDFINKKGGGNEISIPNLYEYISYKDYSNENKIILVKYIENIENIEIYKDWNKINFNKINDNPYDIIITYETLKKFNNYNFMIFINKIILLNNDKITDLFYNSNEFRYICLIFLFKKLKDKNIINKNNINSTLSLLFYQFIIGGIIRNEQINIIYNILTDYGFSNTYLDIINNTYNINDEYKKKIDSDNNLYINDKSLIQKPKRNIYNLIMGSGKTKFITPIICIYIIEYIKYKKLHDKNFLLVLPTKLVNQSKIFLSYILEFYMNYNIELINNLNINNINSNNNSIIICSDETLKYYFLGLTKETKYIFNKWDLNKNFVLLDEADIILDPMSSEMNYPLNESKKNLNKNIFNNIIEIIFNIYSKSNNKVLIAKQILIEKSNKINIDIELYIDFISFIKKENINNLEEIFIKYKTINSNIDKFKNIEYDTYCLYDYLYNIYNLLDTIYEMVNRKDFGFAYNYNEIITPFQYSETPMIGSEYTDIFIIMLLTIKSYYTENKISFYKLCKFMKFIIKKLENINIKKYIDNKYYIISAKLFNKYNLPNILFKFNIQLDNENINKLYTSFISLGFEQSIINILSDIDFIKDYCKYILYDYLYYYKEQLNISGVNLAFSQYFNYLCGFTGTPEDKFKYIDINPLNILKKNNTSICLEQDAIELNCNILNYNFDYSLLSEFNENYDYKDFILSNITNIDKYNVIIDIGAIFINLSYTSLAKLIFKYFKNILRIVYIDLIDNFYYIDRNNINNSIVWDYSIFSTDLVFFDNSHITGIDVVLPDNFNGLITLRANTRYRDYIQGLYRLRKINSTQTADIFIMPNIFTNPIIINEYTNIIINNKNKIETNIKKSDIINILNNNEKNYFKNQKYYFNIQQLRVIKTFYKEKEIEKEEDSYKIKNILNKITDKFEDYINNLIIEEILIINNKYIKSKDNFIKKYFCNNINDMQNLIKQFIEFYQYIFININNNNLLTQLQIQTQEQLYSILNIMVQNQIKLQESIISITSNIKYNFNKIKIETFENYQNIDDNNDDNNNNNNNNNNPYKNTYIITKNNFEELNKVEINEVFLFNISINLINLNKETVKCVEISDKYSISSDKYYIFNRFLIIFLKDIKYEKINYKKVNLIKVGEYYEILNLSNYYKQININHYVFDLFGNNLINNNINITKYDEILISNIKYYFTSFYFEKEYYSNSILMIPNYNSLFIYDEIEKLINSKSKLLSLVDIFESMNLLNKYNIKSIFDLKYINTNIIITVILSLLTLDPIINENNIITNYFKEQFIIEKTSNLKINLDEIINNIRCYYTTLINQLEKVYYNKNKETYKNCENNKFIDVKKNYYISDKEKISINSLSLNKCISKILKKEKVLNLIENAKFKKSLKVFQIIVRIISCNNNNIELNVISKNYFLLSTYIKFINKIQNDDKILIESNNTFKNLF